VYEAEFIQGFLKKNERKLAIFFNLTFRYIDDVLSLNNCKLGDFVDHIYPMELEIKDTTDTDRSVSSWVMRSRKLNKNRQHNGQRNKDKRRNNDLQNITQKTKDRATRKPLNM
jgi:hypothetical protein